MPKEVTLPGGEVMEPPAGVPGPGAGGSGIEYLGQVLRNGLTYLLIFAVVLSLINVVWSGIQWASASGDKEKISRARGRITWAIIGLIITFLTFFILSLIGHVFKVNLLGI